MASYEFAHDRETWEEAWGHRGLVLRVLREYYPSEVVNYHELLADGLKGVCHAMRRFDPAKGAFSTIATWHIRRCLHRAILKRDSPIRVPEKARAAAYDHLKKGVEGPPGRKNVRAALDLIRRGVTREGAEWTWAQYADPLNDREIEDAAEARAIVDDALAALPEFVAEIVRSRFSIGREERTRQAIGEELGMTKHMVSYWQAQGLKGMREFIEKSGRLDLFA